MDIGPTGDGRIPVIMQQRLIEIGDWLKVNGEAIYGTGTWKDTCQWSDGAPPRQGYGQFRVQYDVAKMVGTRPVHGQARKQAFFTTKSGVLYAILPRWPGRTFTLKGLTLGADAKVQMLGVKGALSHQTRGGSTVIRMPELAVDELPCKYAWTLKITGVEAAQH